MSVLPKGARITWLGHSTWLLETPGGTRVLMDPFLESNPACPEAYQGGGVDPIDLILVSHGHADHIADLQATAERTGATVLGIFDLTSWLAARIDVPTIGGNKGGTMHSHGLEITLVNAVHSSSLDLDGSFLDLGDPCGMIIELEDGYRIYNAGDTAVFGDMALIAELYRPDLCILPIGDHFTMGPLEAAKAVELLGAREVLPQHWGTFPLLTGTPEALQERVGDRARIHHLRPGDSLD